MRRHVYNGSGGPCWEVFDNAVCGLSPANIWHRPPEQEEMVKMYPEQQKIEMVMEYPQRELPEPGDRELPVFGGDSPDGVWEPEDPGSPPPAPEGEWERAVRWLTTEGVELGYGPWPVRKLVLPDASSVSRLGTLLGHLNALEEVFTVSVVRSYGKPYREAYVMWGWALGASVETVCDELAVRYDDNA